jgi:predicted hydrocarbon binding protein
VISIRLVKAFIAAAVNETGVHNLPSVLEKTGLMPEDLEQVSAASAADVYARFQQALRLFYGRGARGMLLRIGRNTWNQLMAQASLKERADLEIARRLPVPARRRRMLELVAARLQEGGGSASVHTLDIDLLLVDRGGAAAVGQKENEPICHVTLGLVQEALFWATGQDADVDEIKCKAVESPACEFKIKFGGR